MKYVHTIGLLLMHQVIFMLIKNKKDEVFWRKKITIQKRCMNVVDSLTSHSIRFNQIIL